MSEDAHSILLAELFDALQIEELLRCDAFGLPCLRGNDQIVAALNSKNQSFIIKLPPNKVNYLIAEGWANTFHPEIKSIPTGSKSPTRGLASGLS